MNDYLKLSYTWTQSKNFRHFMWVQKVHVLLEKDTTDLLQLQILILKGLL